MLIKRFFINKRTRNKYLIRYTVMGLLCLAVIAGVFALSGVYTPPVAYVSAENITAPPSPSATSSETAAPEASTLPSPDPSYDPAVSDNPAAEPSVTPEPSAVPSASPEKEAAPVKTQTPKKPAPKPVDLNALVSKNFEVKADKYYDDTAFSSNTYDYTDKDIYMLAQLIYLEARGESYKGKIAVANVAMNRVLSPGYPGNTIKEVLTAPNQFCFNTRVRPDAACRKAAKDVLAYEKWVIPQNVYYFKVAKSKSDWGRFDFNLKIGGHGFYEYNYYGRYNGSAVPAALFERVYRWPEFGCKPGARVKKLQKMLRAFGYKVKADGYFGKSIQDAVKDFQKKRGLKADGVAGPDTLKAMIKKYGVDKFKKL